MRLLPTLGFLLPLSAALALDSAVVFNEVHYHPLDELTQTEWIELKSNQGVDIDISGWSITGGANYTFPANTVLPGNGTIVVAKTPAQISGAVGPFTGSLSNNSETIRLRHRGGRIMDELSYEDSGDWPLAADGLGFTLARKNSQVALTGPSAWTASTASGGTPGTVNFSTSPVTSTLVGSGSSWKYSDSVDAPPSDWKTTAYDDSTWLTGDASLGSQPPVTSLAVTANLAERFRASDITGLTDGQTVATWTDTATGDSASQNGVAGTTTPTYRSASTPNGKPAVRFDGNDEIRTSISPGIAATGGWTVFMVVKGNAAQSANAYLLDRSVTGNPLMSLKSQGGFFALQKRYSDATGLGGPVSTTAISTSAWQIVTIRRNTTLGAGLNRFETWVNCVLEGTDTDTGGALTPEPVIIGSHFNNGVGFNGDIAEVLVYKSSLSDFDFQRVGSYLESEYGLTTAFQTIKTPLATAATTSYLRKSFTFTGNPAQTTLRLNRTVADGAVFYLNGTELVRANVAAGTVTHTTTASSVIATPSASGLISVPATALLNGTNVLAVSLHKGVGGTSTYFDAALEATETPVAITNSLVFNEIASALDPSFFIEFKNTSASSVSTAGWAIKTSLGQTLPLPAATVSSGALVSFTAAELGLPPLDGLRLTLTSSNGLVHRDSREVTNSLRGLTSTGFWGRPDNATPGTANVTTVSNAIVINEIFYKGMNGSLEQWIELHNRSASPVDVSGWGVSEGVSYTFPVGTTIPAGGFAVVAWDPAAFTVLHPGITAFGPFTGSLSGAGETVTLSDANNNIADTVRYGDGGLWPQWADGGGSSLELRDPDADNAKPGAWDASDESTKTAWQTVTYTGSPTLNPANDPTTWNEFIFGMLSGGEVLIDDVSVTTSATQLIQNGAFTSNSSTWRIIGNHSGSVVPDPFSPGNNVLKLSATGASDPMHNQAQTTLKAGASFHTLAAASTYSVSFRAKWLRGSNRLHSRFYANRLPRQTVLNVPATGGTPGSVNSRLAANIGPTLSAFGHTPVVPAASTAATVTVSASDPDGITSVFLFRSVNGAAFTSTAMTASNGTYSGTVTGQAAGAIVQFYVQATDSLGAVSFFPPEGAASRALIQWADGRYTQTLPSGVKPHNLRVITTPADATEMYKQENLMSNADVPCTIVWNESVVYYRAGASLKSSEHGRFDINRVGYNLSFPSDDLFLGVHGGIALDRSGGTGMGQSEILVKTLSSLAGGIAAPEDDIIRIIPAKAPSATGITFDGSGMLGAAILSKTRLKDDFLEGQWDNGADGMMFKYERIYVMSQTINPATRVVDATVVPENPKVPQSGAPSPPGVNVVNLGADKELYRWHWLVENGRDTDNFSGLINVLTAVGQTGGTTAFNTQTAQHIDVSTWLRACIPAALFGTTDNYMGTGGGQHNTLIYFPPGGKAQLFPWDLDFLNQTNSSASLTAGGDVAKFIANPVYSRLYWGHMQDILNRSFNTATMSKWATHYSKFGSDMTAMVAAYLTPRAAYAQGQITANVPATTFSISSPANNATIASPSTTLTGAGWVDVAEVRLVGSTEPLAVTWTSATAFTLTLPLGAGTQSYTLKAYNPQGTEVGTVTRTYTNSSSVAPASAANLAITELNFNPVGTSDLEEFIELTNVGTGILDLSNCHFDETGPGGIAYTFPAGTQLAVGARILVVRDRAAYQAAYGNLTNVAPGQWDSLSALSNSGETLTLFAANGTLITSFGYTDSINAADGGGYTMVRFLATASPDLNTYAWQASTAPGGSPGVTDITLATPATASTGLPFSAQLTTLNLVTGSAVTYAKTAGPAWLTVSSSGALGGTPPVGAAGSNLLSVNVTAGALTQAVRLELVVNNSPAFAANPITANATGGTAFTGQFAATDADAGALLSYLKVSGPAWLLVSPTGALSGTPSNADAGLNAFTVSVSDGPATIEATLNVTVTASDPSFNSFLGSNFSPTDQANPLVSGPTADPDGDGLPNLLEYAFATNPNQTSSGRLPEAGLVNVSTEQHIALVYTRLKGAADLTFTPEFSPTPANADFTASAFTQVTVVDNLDGTETITIRDASPITGSAPRFARIRVTQN